MALQHRESQVRLLLADNTRLVEGCAQNVFAANQISKTQLGRQDGCESPNNTRFETFPCMIEKKRVPECRAPKVSGRGLALNHSINSHLPLESLDC